MTALDPHPGVLTPEPQDRPSESRTGPPNPSITDPLIKNRNLKVYTPDPESTEFTKGHGLQSSDRRWLQQITKKYPYPAPISPLKKYRELHKLSARETAGLLKMPLPTYYKYEAAQIDTLDYRISALMGIDARHYAEFRYQKRLNLDFRTKAPILQSPEMFTGWRLWLSERREIAPTMGAFSAALCLNFSVLQNFEKKASKLKRPLPTRISQALTDAGVEFYD